MSGQIHREQDMLHARDAAAASLSTECRYLQFDHDICRCSHPRVRLSAADDVRSLCRTCTFFEELQSSLTPADKIDSIAVQRAWTWAVGMTTAPRRVPTLKRSLDSVAAAGWPQLRLFAEPGTELPKDQEYAVTQRDVVLGAFPNFLLGLSELYLRDPHADAYLMFQDDIEVAVGTRRYLEQKLWPEPAAECGIVSLYCPSNHAAQGPSGFQINTDGWGTWGALAYVFSPAAVLAFLCDLQVAAHRRYGRADGLKNVDSVAGKWCSRSGWKYYVHAPSLVQHTGRTSTLYPTAGIGGRRRAAIALSRISSDVVENLEH